MNIEIANRLVQMRKEKGYSQEALAEQLGISRQAVSKWERAESSPDTSNLITLAKLYQVSLDELLDTDQEKFESGDPINKRDGFNRGVEAEAFNNTGEYVKIGWSGIHVKDGADVVHVGWKGIHVIENGQDVVCIGPGYVTDEIDWGTPEGIYISDKHGVWINGEEKTDYTWKYDGILAGILFCIYLWIGFEYRLWHPGWVIFLAVPIMNSFVTAFKNKNASMIVYPTLVIIGYLYLGFTANLWHPAWLLFLTIPIFSNLVTTVKKRNIKHFSYGMVVIVGYLSMGIVLGTWHPTWIAFLTIPIYYGLVGKIRSRQQKGDF